MKVNFLLPIPKFGQKRLLWLAVLILAELLYIPINRGVHGGVTLATPWDASIQLVPVWIVPYLLAWLWWLACVLWALLKMDSPRYRAFMVGFIAAILVSDFIYVLFPTYVVRPILIGSGWEFDLVRTLYGVDKAYNAFPSGHTYTSVLICLFWWGWRPHLRILWVLITALILISALVTRQHNLLDLVGGGALALASYCFGWWVNKPRPG